MSFGLFNECWSYAPLSHIFKRSAHFICRNLRDTKIEPKTCRANANSAAAVQKLIKTCTSPTPPTPPLAAAKGQ